MGNFLVFFNISGGEILVVVVVAYLVFGPKKIPELARMVGKGINEFRRATDDIKKEITKEANKLKNEVKLDIDDPLNFNRPPANAGKDKKPATKPENKDENTPDDKDITDR